MEEMLGQRLVIVTVSVDETGREIAGGGGERSYGRIVGVAGGLVTVELDDGAQRVINTREVPITLLEGQARHYLGAGRRRARPRFIAKQRKLLTLGP